ncbi:G-type lectin S-receptor-like serine/threonine-protein kinase At1g11410 [Rosa chinensis]|uniref:G-type lectin S-receptor-like serine/threonine-protein kinase At1g11410 n=1 Tax=Rosa chinensis TaxID=74649 RepID=UPI001AD8FD68|nr:G-type lectin S-receptor-like serine/threonine-protein kinase At1g11410 [Rosa chinensis]
MSSSIKAFIKILLLFLLLPSSICQLSLDALKPNLPIKDGDILVSSTQIFALGALEILSTAMLEFGITKFQSKPLSGLRTETTQSMIPMECYRSMVMEALSYMERTQIGLNRRSGLEWHLTSWKSKDDPGTGSCTYGIDPMGFPQFFLRKGREALWRTGPWIGDKLNALPVMTATFYNASFVNNEDEISLVFAIAKDSLITRVVIDESGILQVFVWNDQWIKFYSHPTEWCDYYGQCGPNTNCDSEKDYKLACTCLPGFESKSPSLSVGESGCIRKAGASTCQNGEGFVKVARVKIPDSSTAYVNMSMSLEECKQNCLMDCSCTAYTSADDRGGGIGCVTWHGDLMDMRTFSDIGQDLYVRVDVTSLGLLT